MRPTRRVRRRPIAAGGIRYSWSQLARFLPTYGKLRVGAAGALAFFGGLAESSVLILLTLTADAMVRGIQRISLGPFEVTPRQAVLCALALVLLRSATIIAAASVSSRFAYVVTKRAQTETMASYLEGNYEARAARPPGDLNAVVVNHGRFTGDLAAAFAQLAVSLLGLMAFGTMSLVVNLPATLAIAVLGLVVLGSMQPIRRKSQTLARVFAGASRVLASEVTEIEMLQREIEVFHVEDSALSRIASQVNEAAATHRRLRLLNLSIPQLFQAAMLTAGVLSLLLLVDGPGGGNLATVGAVVLLLIRSMSSAQQFVTANQRLIELTSYAEGLNDLMDTLSTGRRVFGDTRPSKLTPLTVGGLNFNYHDSANVLNDINLEFREGELVGIVGPSGAGKSTLVELLLRLRAPASGRIVGGGTAWDEIDPEEFANRVAFVPQNPTLIAGTVAENVDLFRCLPEARIREAIAQAHLEAEIAALPDGIHTRLGPDDRALSGGQRQRLTIARSLAGDPDVLILDEPTSALDAVSERAIRRTLVELPEGRLVIVVAHRISTLRSCSRIVVLGKGRVEVDGTPREVAEQSDFFQVMVDEQV